MKGKISKTLEKILRDPDGRKQLRELDIRKGGQIATSDGKRYFVTSSEFVASDYIRNKPPYSTYR